MQEIKEDEKKEKQLHPKPAIVRLAPPKPAQLLERFTLNQRGNPEPSPRKNRFWDTVKFPFGKASPGSVSLTFFAPRGGGPLWAANAEGERR